MPRVVPWLLVALCCVLAVASRSISDTFAVFVPALQDGFAASRSSVTVVYSFALFAGGTGAPLAGWIADRFGLRALTVTGMAIAALGTLSAWQATELWQLYLGLGILLGFGGMCVSGVLSSMLLGRWFPVRRLGVAMAVAWSASGVGAILMIPLAQYLIETGGWRHAYLVFAVITACCVPVLIFLPWRRIALGRLEGSAAEPPRPSPGGSALPGPTVSEAVRDWPFWALSCSFGLTSLGIFSVAPQAVVYLLEHGIDAVLRLDDGHDVGNRRAIGIDRGEAAERPMVHHIRVGDRQDDPRRVLAQPLVEHVLQVDDIRLAVGAYLHEP